MKSRFKNLIIPTILQVNSNIEDTVTDLFFLSLQSQCVKRGVLGPNVASRKSLCFVADVYSSFNLLCLLKA